MRKQCWYCPVWIRPVREQYLLTAYLEGQVGTIFLQKQIYRNALPTTCMEHIMLQEEALLVPETRHVLHVAPSVL